MANSVKWSHRAIQRGPNLYSTIEAGILPTYNPPIFNRVGDLDKRRIGDIIKYSYMPYTLARFTAQQEARPDVKRES